MSNRELTELLRRLERFEETLGRVRQYIGARYVPTYYENSLDPTSSEWEANVNYDPLTIVSLPNMHSYQSKKFVPSTIGTPASNPEYWYDQGYANAYYQALQDQIDDMNDGTVAGSLQNQIDVMKDGDVSGSLQNQIDTISNSVSDKADKEEVEKLSKNWSSKKVLFVGDSYGTASGNFFSICSTILNLSNAENLAVSGAGLIVSGNTFLSQIQNYSGDKTKVDEIIICGGLNDCDNGQTDISAITSAIGAIMNEVDANYPKAHVIIGFVGNAIDNSSYVGTKKIDNRLWIEYAYGNVNRKNLSIISIANALKLSTALMDTDGVHPSSAGHRSLGKALAMAISGYKYDAMYPIYGMAAAIASGFANTPDLTPWRYSCRDNMLFLNISSGTSFQIANGGTFGGSNKDFVTFNELYFNKPFTRFMPLILNGFDNQSHQFPLCLLTFTGNKLQIKTQDYVTHTATDSVGSIILPPLEYAVPLEYMG